VSSTEFDEANARLIATQDSAEFRELRQRFRRFVFPMTAVFLSWYLLYVLASGYARDFMGHELVGNINVAYVFGLLQFVSTFLIAYLYERYMEAKVDPLARALRERLEGEGVTR
jgi:uncharacterized membrane protein (DUF485 family)